ncbi:hypothetical protein RhiirA4_481793 [Rhizophagus irregularis]|uniref:Uncharacterized protein n=1 Tax=Rhizophagus irregularis TaxID=588596 RepID=A0A2I1HK07_9GLOM|nr:hypothetical protein RhiirA4_481793 [Rhizophagus irregularis]
MRLELKKVKAGKILVLPNISNVDPDFMKAWKVIKVQIRGQYKYKTVRAQILLDDNFEKSFKKGLFRICISKNFIRWYDASLGLKGRQERDKWQTVRDLTNEEMESIRKGSLYEFTKQLQKASKTAFVKIIKITKNWKVIGYFKNLKEMEEAVENSCTQGDLNQVLCIRNKKIIYREEKKVKGQMEKKEEPEGFLPS